MSKKPMGSTVWEWLPRMMSAPAWARRLQYFCWFASGSRTYSSPQWGKAMTTSAPASRSFWMSPSMSAL